MAGGKKLNQLSWIVKWTILGYNWEKSNLSAIRIEEILRQIDATHSARQYLPDVSSHKKKKKKKIKTLFPNHLPLALSLTDVSSE